MTHIKSFVIRQARMSDSQRHHYQQHFPKYEITYSVEKSIFDYVSPEKAVVVELGFGMGDSLFELAEANPQIQYVGIEVHRPGVGKLVRRLEEKQLQNVRIVEHDAVEVFHTMIPAESLDGVHVFFPDPWPKKRHHKRRLLQQPFLHAVAKCVRPGGYVYMVTDWQDYAEHILTVCDQEPLLHNPAGGFHEALPWRPATSFERKAQAAGRPIREVYCKRV